MFHSWKLEILFGSLLIWFLITSYPPLMFFMVSVDIRLVQKSQLLLHQPNTKLFSYSKGRCPEVDRKLLPTHNRPVNHACCWCPVGNQGVPQQEPLLFTTLEINNQHLKHAFRRYPERLASTARTDINGYKTGITKNRALPMATKLLASKTVYNLVNVHLVLKGKCFLLTSQIYIDTNI